MKSFTKILAAVQLVALLAAVLCALVFAAKVKATPTTSTVKVGGKPFSFQAYNISGNNYFKLRDLALVLSSTSARFSVTWNAEKNEILLLTNQHYQPVGGELAVPANPTAAKAEPTSSNVYYNGLKQDLTAYLIGDNNYFKLRDICLILNIGVTWDDKYNTIDIDPSTEYCIAAFLEILPNGFYNPAQDTIRSYDTDRGYILITKYNATYYSIMAVDLSSNHDLGLYRDVLGVLVNNPEEILSAMDMNKGTETKTMTSGGKMVAYYYSGSTRSAEIKWS